MPALFVDGGTADGLIDESRAFHAELLALGVAHQYAEWPGAHDWRYWRAHVGESLAWLAARLDSTP
jgi:S-formylglutathione hydrolase FrmB